MKPHITEKTYQLTTLPQPVFTFLISRHDNCATVVAKVRDIYGKEAIKVRIVKNAAKTVKRRGVKGVTSGKVKALVTLKKGQSIAAFDIDTKTDKTETKKTKQQEKAKVNQTDKK